MRRIDANISTAYGRSKKLAIASSAPTIASCHHRSLQPRISIPTRSHTRRHDAADCPSITKHQSTFLIGFTLCRPSTIADVTTPGSSRNDFLPSRDTKRKSCRLVLVARGPTSSASTNEAGTEVAQSRYRLYKPLHVTHPYTHPRLSHPSLSATVCMGKPRSW